jgi:hypothetical protein
MYYDENCPLFQVYLIYTAFRSWLYSHLHITVLTGFALSIYFDIIGDIWD